MDNRPVRPIPVFGSFKRTHESLLRARGYSGEVFPFYPRRRHVQLDLKTFYGVNVDDVHLRRTAGAGDAAQVSTDQWWYLGHLEPGGPAILRSSDDCKACWDALLKERK